MVRASVVFSVASLLVVEWANVDANDTHGLGCDSASSTECDASGFKSVTQSIPTDSSLQLRGSTDSFCKTVTKRVSCNLDEWWVGPWSEWVCEPYTRVKSRSRTVINKGKHRSDRPRLEEFTRCDSTPCTIYTEQEDTGPWGECKQAQGQWIRTKVLGIKTLAGPGGSCPPPSDPSRQAIESCSPIDCVVKSQAEDTGKWGPCQVDEKGQWSQTKVLGVKTQPSFGGMPCPTEKDPRRIAVQPCSSSLREATAVLNVLAYNDVYELLQDSLNGQKMGGPSRVVPIAKEMKARNPNSLVIFAGDTMSPSLWSSQFKGMQMVEAHNAIGVDYACLGNHEFDFGVDAFLNVSSASKFPWLNANCYEEATGKLLRNTIERAIKEFNDPIHGKIKIGLFGVMYDMKDSSKGLYWTDPIEAAKTQVTSLREAGVDMIIALTHQEMVDDNRFSAEVSGIDMIYAGHDHESMLQTTFGTTYVKADMNFRSVWTSHIEYLAEAGGNPAVFRMKHSSVPITEDMPTDPALEETIANYAERVRGMFSRQVGALCGPLDLTYKVVCAADAPIGHIFTDAQMNFYGKGSGDVAVMNGGGIRTDMMYPAGPITLGQVVAWSPFGNTIMVVQTDGASLKKFITREMLASCGNGAVAFNGLYVHTAGVKYTFKCTGLGVGSVSSIEWSGHPTRKGPVLDTDSFKLVLSNYLYKREFITTPHVNYTTIVKESEAGRVDTAMEAYVSGLPDATLCESDKTVRSFVTF